MKVFFEEGQCSFPKGGKKDGIIFCYFRQRDICLGRRYISIPLLPQNTKIISMGKITLSIWQNLPLCFKHDLSVYARLYKAEYPDLRRKHLNSYGIFLKIIHKIDRFYQFSKLEDTSYSMYALLYGHLSVADFIRIGYLPQVRKGYILTARILSVETIFPLIPSILLPEQAILNLNIHSKPG